MAKRVAAWSTGLLVFAALGIGLLAGRTLTQRDLDESSVAAGLDVAPVELPLVINRTMASEMWPGENALGKLVRPNSNIEGYRARVRFADEPAPVADEAFVQAILDREAVYSGFFRVDRYRLRHRLFEGSHRQSGRHRPARPFATLGLIGEAQQRASVPGR